MGQHALDQLADFAAQRDQGIQAWRMADGARQVHQVDPLQGEQVALRNHTAQASVFHQAYVGDMPLGHGHGCVEGAGLGAEVERLGGHVPRDGRAQVGIGRSHHLAQVAQGKDTGGVALRVDHHDAADLLLVHQPHGVAQRRVGAAHHRVAHGQFTQWRVQRILGAEGFHRALAYLLVDLVEQAADPAQGKIPKHFRHREHADERGLVQLQAEGVLTGQVLGTGRSLAEQGSQREAFAAGDFEGGLHTRLDQVLALTHHAALLDDVEVLDRPVGRFDDAFAAGIEAQLALFDQVGQVAVFHLVERRKTLQELQGALDVLQHCCPARLAVGVLFAHETDRIAMPNYIYLYIGAGHVVLCLHGRLAAGWCPLDVSL
ncbi:hypothetical protein D3C79_546250 [compost metagenome]